MVFNRLILVSLVLIMICSQANGQKDSDFPQEDFGFPRIKPKTNREYIREFKNRTVTIYYKTGEKKRIAKYGNRWINGSVTEWYKTGEIKTKGKIENCIDLTGKLTYWSVAGEIMKKEFYRKGKLIRTKEY